LYQIWLLPERNGLAPSYEQRSFSESERRGELRIVASPDGADGSLTIHQNARLYLSSLEAGKNVVQAMSPGRHAWLQVLRGHVTVNGEPLSAGDGAAVSEEESLLVRSKDNSEVMLFDLA
jgi:redox-sensitive bicupin YhaK (pirin superfamily)